MKFAASAVFCIRNSGGKLKQEFVIKNKIIIARKLASAQRSSQGQRHCVLLAPWRALRDQVVRIDINRCCFSTTVDIKGSVKDEFVIRKQINYCAQRSSQRGHCVLLAPWRALRDQVVRIDINRCCFSTTVDIKGSEGAKELAVGTLRPTCAMASIA